MKKRGPFVYKVKIAGGLFGTLAGPFGNFFGFLIGHLVDILLESARNRREVFLFLSSPETSELADVEDGVFSFFTLAGILLLARGRSLKHRTNELIDALRPYFPVRSSDYKHFGEIGEALESSEVPTDMRAHARVVGAKNPDFSYILEGLRVLCGMEEAAALTEPVVALLGEIATGWERGAEKLAGLLGLSGEGSSDSWGVLGLRPEAGEEELKRVFRVLASHFHPDGAAVLSDLQKQETEEAFKRIRRAYEACLLEVSRRPA
jgi:hypothetical protein